MKISCESFWVREISKRDVVFAKKEINDFLEVFVVYAAFL